MTTRRTFLSAISATVAALSAQAAAPSLLQGSPSKGKPNIVFFLVDDMGWQDTSVPFYYRNGTAVKSTLNRRYKTPNMERLAKMGMLFTSAYAQPICSPTRCSFISGMNSARHRVTNWTLRLNRSNDQESPNRLKAPKWATNGIQPAGTPATGHCEPPYWAVKATAADKHPIAYKMTTPFICAKGLPQFLKEAGYTTIHTGKAHYGSSNYHRKGSGSGAPTPGADPKNFGFDYNIAGYEAGGPGSYRGDTKYGQKNKPNTPEWWTPGLDENNWLNYTDNVFMTDALTYKTLTTIDQIRQVNPKKPFFLQMAHYAVHAPLDNGCAWDASRSNNPNCAKDTLNPNPHDGIGWNNFERNYTTLLKGMDDSLGQIIDYLQEKKILDNTVIFFMSDNGGLEEQGRIRQANAPLRSGKGSGYEGGIREPMIAYYPGVTQAGSRCDTPVIIEDFFATILDIAGLNPRTLTGLAMTHYLQTQEVIPQEIDGISFLPLLRGETMTKKRPLIFHSPNSWRGINDTRFDFYTAMRYDHWKLIYQHDSQALELYDLDHDIGEKHNLAQTNPDQVSQLAAIMGKELRRYHAQMPTYLPGNTGHFPAGTTVPWPDRRGAR